MKPSLEDLAASIQEDATVRRIVLVPLMLVSGYHVRKDLAGVRENTWTNTFLKAGYAVECIKRGLGEERFLQNIFVEYLKNVILIKNIID